MKRLLWFVVLLHVFGSSCSKKEPLFVKLNPGKTHVNFSNELSNTPELNILNYLYYYNGGGVAAADFNNDGWIDLYFTGNQVADKLYINRGNWVFEDITQHSGIDNKNGWTTGVTHVDINNDGLLDIYICKASGYRSLKGRNLLYVNKGVNEKGIPTFKEEAALYGLDFSGLSTHAAFLDYDQDGDLDMYLLNHSVHPNRTYGSGKQRLDPDPISGDILFQNQNGFFTDVSEKAGIFQGKSGYGLGLSVSDINNDGYPDIYVGNDFFENDYLYINQQDGTFKEVISSDNTKLGHTTHYSMGNGIADLNNDGFMDIVSLDMLPENLETYKSSGLEFEYPIYRQYLNQGYAPQFMANSLHLNLNGELFSEIGNLAGIAATEWSWGTLMGDFDNDGFKDLFISNGIKGATNDMDYMNFIANENIQRRITAGMSNEDLPLIQEIPEKKVPNYIFRNNGDLTFSMMNEHWLENVPSFSNGCVYADFDNDGDLDIAINNIDEKATILENSSPKGNFLKLKFKGRAGNRFGIGAKVKLFLGNKIIIHENFPAQGYLSSLPNSLLLGLGKDSIVDSLEVLWPQGKKQLLRAIPGNTEILLSASNAKTAPEKHLKNRGYTTTNLSPIFVHNENIPIDFDREPLIPYANSNQGPCLSIVDINKDGLDDFFIGGAKKQSGRLFVQETSGQFISQQEAVFQKDAIKEDVASAFFDANNDGWPDLLVASGGNEFTTGKPLRPRLYINKNGLLAKDETAFENVFLNAADIGIGDFDGDGDLDIALVANSVPTSFGQTPRQFLFENNGQGKFKDVTETIAPELMRLGNIQSVRWIDINADGKLDLTVAGHWMPISIFINDGKKLILQQENGLQNTHGWWNSVVFDDFDTDGDLDMVCGNWGLNTKLKASNNKPINLYRHDFDDNGSVDPLVTYFHQGTETPFASKNELAKQLPFLNKKFLSYGEFAKASITDLFGSENLANADQKKVYELQSSYFENDGNGNFLKKPLPLIAQASQINDILIEDVNLDGFNDLLLVGNNYTISTQLGRLDAFHGLILLNNKRGSFVWDKTYSLNVSGVCTAIKKIRIQQQEGYLLGRNDTAPVVLTKE